MFYLQCVLTAVMVFLMDTTNLATHVMDMFHAAVTFFTTGRAKRVTKTNSCGTTLKKDARKHPLPVIQLIYHIKEYFVFFFLMIAFVINKILNFVHLECKLLRLTIAADIYFNCFKNCKWCVFAL